VYAGRAVSILGNARHWKASHVVLKQASAGGRLRFRIDPILGRACADPGAARRQEIQRDRTLLDGEAYMFGKDMQLYKSNVKMTDGQHQAALKKGARELRPRIVVYRWAGRLYMMENIGRNAAVNYEDQFILDP
jgi:hypothetical protein